MGFAHGFSAIVAMPIASDVNLIQRRQQFLIHLMESAQFGGGNFKALDARQFVLQDVSQPKGFWLCHVRFPLDGKLNALKLPFLGTCEV
jgi:hypothetical protein